MLIIANTSAVSVRRQVWQDYPVSAINAGEASKRSSKQAINQRSPFPVRTLIA
jgi:hypothetical protein